jgi:hypothetical protein
LLKTKEEGRKEKEEKKEGKKGGKYIYTYIPLLRKEDDF